MKSFIYIIIVLLFLAVIGSFVYTYSVNKKENKEPEQPETINGAQLINTIIGMLSGNNNEQGTDEEDNSNTE